MSARKGGLPQLRVRTEFSFRKALGSPARLAARAAELGAPGAGCVDVGGGTWAHVRWEKACAAAGIVPLFGAEIVQPREDGRRPAAWALAADARAFYRLNSEAHAAVPEGLSHERLAQRGSGVLVFAGAALDDPDTFDYIDINPRSPVSRRRALALHARTNKPLVVTSDVWLPSADDMNEFLALIDARMATPQWMLTEEELAAAMPDVPADKFAAAVRGCWEAFERAAAARLSTAPMIRVEGDLRTEVERGRASRLERGHLTEWSDAYEQRLQHELEVIEQKAFESYFLVVSDLVRWAKRRMLVGPARGSSAGSLVCYLLDITEVNPLKHNLIFERFIDVTRSDMPDIDIDFSDRSRDLVFDYLADKYGAEHVARIGNISTLKPRSAMMEVGKRFGVPIGETFAVKNVLIEYSSGDSRYGKSLEDTFQGTAAGRSFVAKRPAAARAMAAAEGAAWHTSVHAAGVIVSNEPICEFCTVAKGVVQCDKPDTERLNLLKIDALGLRTLGVIEDAGVVTAAELYSMPLDDAEVLAIFNAQKYSGIFQFEGPAQRRVASQIDFNAFEQIDHVTALARPGPLGGGASNHYIQRSKGREPVTYRHPTMAQYLADTHGVVLYQEQVMRISREIGQFPWAVVSEIRKAMSGRKGKEYFDRRGAEFVAGAASIGMPEEDARTVWSEICTFGAWGMNRSHTVSYAIISYWCAWLKRYHPLEYAAACLRSAKDDEQTVEILREMINEGIHFIPFDAERSAVDWSVQNGELIGGFKALHGIGPAKAVDYVERRRLGTWTDKDRERIEGLPCKWRELFPAHALWGELYTNPAAHGIAGRVREVRDLEDGENAVLVLKMVRRERRDENETVRAARRGFLKEGQTLFLDAFMVDDSIAQPIVVRFRPALWHKYGEPIAENARDGEDWFLVRGRWLKDFSMLIAQKARCLTRRELLE